MAEKKNIKASSSQMLEAAEAANVSTVTMSFYDSKGTLLNQLTDLKARARELCGQKEDACWQDIKQGENSSATFPVPVGQTMLVEAKGTIPSGADETSDKLVPFVPALAYVGCGQTKNLKMFEAAPAAVSPQADKVTLTITGHRCVSKDDHRDRMSAAKITSATAELVPSAQIGPDATAKGKKPAPIAATILDGIAFFSLQKNTDYCFHVRLEGECVNTCPPFPFTWLADEDRELSICVEPRERMVSLLFVDSCGKAVEPSDVLVDQGGGRTQPLLTGRSGTYTLTGLQVGRLRLLSKSYRFTPHEIRVDDRMNQAHVFEAIKVPGLDRTGDVEEIVLEFAEKIKEGEHGSFRILTLEGKLVETFDAGSGQLVRYSPSDHEPLMIQALRNGQVIDQVVHPGRKSA
ncbi:MAG: hypothetical protein ABSA78_03045 [Candidatus Sulfotelmatobacter sp.]